MSQDPATLDAATPLAAPGVHDGAVRRVLVIDDNEAIHADFRKVLCELGADPLAVDEAMLFGAPLPAAVELTFEVHAATQGQEGYEMVRRALAQDRPYQLAFVDMRMPPGWDGVETITRLWEADPALQVVICTAYSDYSWEQIVARIGHTDQLLFLRKPFDDVEVLQLASALTQKWLVTRQANLRFEELRALVDDRTRELQHVASHDRLTGLPNRELLMDRLRQALVRHGRDGSIFAVLFIDFDRFKSVNDSLGHRAGDILLGQVAERLQRSLRPTDSLSRLAEHTIAARLGGDEFVVLLDGIARDHDAARVATRLLELLGEGWHIEGRTVHVTASIGITTSSVGYTDSHVILRDADTAMYRAKLGGKARYVIFDTTMHDEAIRRLRIEADLRTAVTEHQFVLQYQPIVRLADAVLCGFEALVRWRHPSGQLVAPADFISIAEETGTILPLGTWVLHEACRTLQRWREHRPDLAMSVNLSRRQLSSPDLVPSIRAILEETSLPAEALKLELTESAMMEDPDTAIVLLQQIRAMGIGLDLDDFGTGYSSLSCLHQFPVSGLKVDREFVRNLSTRRDHSSVVRAIISLAHILGMRVVAEGIEHAEQLQVLRDLGCDHGQGYYFSAPLDRDDAQALLSRREVRLSPTLFPSGVPTSR